MRALAIFLARSWPAHRERHEPALRRPVFVGVDVSGSFYKAGITTKRWSFLAYYLYGHLRAWATPAH